MRARCQIHRPHQITSFVFYGKIGQRIRGRTSKTGAPGGTQIVRERTLHRVQKSARKTPRGKKNGGIHRRVGKWKRLCIPGTQIKD